MPLQHPEWVPEGGIVWDADLGLGLRRTFNYSVKGRLWDELATITANDTQMSIVNLPRYSYRIAVAFHAASHNQGVKP